MSEWPITLQVQELFLANCFAHANVLISRIPQALQRHACTIKLAGMLCSFVVRVLSVQHQLRSMSLTAGEIPICLSAQTGKGCTIQDVQAVTQDNFCPGSSSAEAAPGSSSDLAGSSPDGETMAGDDYGDHNELDGCADDADGEFHVDYNSNNDSQSDDDLHGERQQQGNDNSAEDDADHTDNDDNAEGDDDNDDHTDNDDNAEGDVDDDDANDDHANNDDNAEGDDDDDDDDHTNDVTTDQESSDSDPVVCNRLQDFQSLVDHAQFEWQKEQIEGHIRSNSLVFNTFIFLQVVGHIVFA